MRILVFFILIGGLGYLCMIIYFMRWNIGHHWSSPRIFLPTGLFRSVFSFFSGVALFRLRDHDLLSWVLPLSPAVAGLLLLAVFAVPGNPSNPPGTYDFLVTLFLFPLITLACSKRHPLGWQKAASNFGGWLSYPLYAVHYPVALLTAITLTRLHLFYMLPTPWRGVVIYLIVVLIACALARFYDEPIRRWLANPRSNRIAP